MNDAIVTRSLVKKYRGGRALDGFSLSVPRGATMGMVGSNGAGKTTWMMTVAGFVLPDSGEISILGLGPFDASVHGGRVSILPQDSELPLEAKPGELLVRYGRLQGLSPLAARREAESLIEAFNLTSHARKPVRALSHGMRKRVMVAQAFIGSPDVVLLDEPLSGLDPIEASRMRSFVLARRGKETIVISSHHLDDIEKMCTHVALMERGRLVSTSPLSVLTSASGRITITLRERPKDLAEIDSLFPGLRTTWNEGTGELVAEFPPMTQPEHVNAVILPALVRCGIVSVTSGRTLEQAYLGR